MMAALRPSRYHWRSPIGSRGGREEGDEGRWLRADAWVPGEPVGQAHHIERHVIIGLVRYQGPRARHAALTVSSPVGIARLAACRRLVVVLVALVA